VPPVSAFPRLLPLLLLLLAPAAFPFAGKVRPPKDIVRLWAEDRLERTLALYALVNESPGTNDTLRRDIPRTLALSLQSTVPFTLPAGQARPVLHGLEQYDPLTFTVGAKDWQRNPSAATNVVFFSDVATNTNLAYILTNGTERTVLRDRSNTIYLDPMRPDWNPSNLLPGQWVWTNRDLPGLPPRFCFQETNAWRRTLRVFDSLYESGAAAPGEIFSRVNADYHLLGTLADLGENRIRLRLLLLDAQRKSAQPLLDKVLAPERWVEETAEVAPLLLALLQGRPMVTNLVFTSEPEGAYVYLDGRYAGATPLTLGALPAGAVSVRFWHQKVRWDAESHARALGARCLSNAGDSLVVDFQPADSGGTNRVPFAAPRKAGSLRVSVGGTPRADIYLDGEIVAASTNHWEARIEAGPHALSVRASKAAPAGSNAAPPDFQERLFQIGVRQDALSELSLAMKPVRRPSGFERIFLDPDRNTVIFGSLGLVGAAATVYTLLKNGEYDERNRLAYARGDYDTYLAEWKTWYQWNQALTACGVATGAALALTLTFRIASISRQEIRIETEYHHGPDVRLRWRSEF